VPRLELLSVTVVLLLDTVVVVLELLELATMELLLDCVVVVLELLELDSLELLEISSLLELDDVSMLELLPSVFPVTMSCNPMLS